MAWARTMYGRQVLQTGMTDNESEEFRWRPRHRTSPAPQARDTSKRERADGERLGRLLLPGVMLLIENGGGILSDIPLEAEASAGVPERRHIQDEVAVDDVAWRTIAWVRKCVSA